MGDLPPPPPYSTYDPHPRSSDSANSSPHTLTEDIPEDPGAEIPRANGMLNGEYLREEKKSETPKKDKKRVKPDTSLGQALLEAVSQRNAQTVRVLLQSNADTNFRSSGSKPALTKAVSNNDVHIVRMLLEEGQPDLEACPSGGTTALYTAVWKGYSEIVKLLLQHKADVNFKPSGGQPAIYRAYVQGYREILWMLLDTENVKLDVTPPGGSTVLYQAAEKGDKDVLQALLCAGAAVDPKPPGGTTAMNRASVRGDFIVTEMLLKSGAKVDVTPPGGTTALWHATKRSDVEMVELLLNYGADANAKPPGGPTVLTQAVKTDKSPDRTIVNMLLQSKKAQG